MSNKKKEKNLIECALEGNPRETQTDTEVKRFQ